MQCRTNRGGELTAIVNNTKKNSHCCLPKPRLTCLCTLQMFKLFIIFFTFQKNSFVDSGGETNSLPSETQEIVFLKYFGSNASPSELRYSRLTSLHPAETLAAE